MDLEWVVKAVQNYGSCVSDDRDGLWKQRTPVSFCQY